MVLTIRGYEVRDHATSAILIDVAGVFLQPSVIVEYFLRIEVGDSDDAR